MGHDMYWIKFHLWLGYAAIHDGKTGELVRFEPTEISRQAALRYRSEGTTAWQEYCRIYGANKGEDE